MYDLHVSCDQREELKGFIEIAEDLGLDGIAITPRSGSKENLKKFYGKIDDLQDETPVDLIKGVEIDPGSVKDLKNKIYKTREIATILVVLGGNYKINRVSSKDSRVDILSHPEYKRSDSGLDHVLAKKANENDVYIEINFREILQTYGKVRSHILSHLGKNIELSKKYDAPFLICSGARDKYELRGGKELAAILELFDLKREETKKITQKIPKNLLEKNKNKISDDIDFEGVEKLK